jgi:hypothetical protein
MQLSDKYAKYYANPSRKNAEILWSAIREYDFSDYTDFIAEVVKLRRSISPQISETDFFLESNGSIASPRKFPLGPHGLYWLFAIENVVKFPEGVSPVLGISGSFFSTRSPTWGRVDNERNELPFSQQYYFNGRMGHPAYLDKLCSYALSIPEPIIISSVPFNFSHLASCPEFVSLVHNSDKVVGLISLNWEAFFPKFRFDGVHINDNCINWTTTVNFFTCRHNQRHFLPTFATETGSIINLLNLACPADYSIDDLVVIGRERIRCTCGRWRMPFSFIPHVDRAIRGKDGIIYDCNLPEQLTSLYYNLQFLQSDDKVEVMYCLNGEFKDRDILTSYFASHGLEVGFSENQYFFAGGKLPVFWSGTCSRASWRGKQNIFI